MYALQIILLSLYKQQECCIMVDMLLHLHLHTHKHVLTHAELSACLQSLWLSSCALPEKVCYLRERREVKGQELQELCCSSATATGKVAFLVHFPVECLSASTQQEIALMASVFKLYTLVLA